MKLKIEKNLLVETAQSAAKAISSRSTLPILGGLLLSVKKDRLTTYATDLEIAIKKEVSISSDEEQDVVVPARLFIDIIKNIPEGTINLVLNKKDNRLEVSSGKARFNINTLPPEDYPKFPEIQSDTSLWADTKELNTAVTSIAGASSRDESRPILTGILLSINGHTANLIATDSYRLATTSVKLEGETPGEKEIIVPAKTLEVLASMSSEAKKIEISLADNQAAFLFDDTKIASKLIGGQFPDHKQLFPEKHEVEITANKEELSEALKRVSLLAHNNAPIKLSAAGNSIEITTQAADVGEAKEEVAAEKSGPDIEIAFNARYLTEGVMGADEKEIVLQLSDPLQPGLIKNKKKETYKYLVMPIRLS